VFASAATKMTACYFVHVTPTNEFASTPCFSDNVSNSAVERIVATALCRRSFKRVLYWRW